MEGYRGHKSLGRVRLRNTRYMSGNLELCHSIWNYTHTTHSCQVDKGLDRVRLRIKEVYKRKFGACA